MSRDIYTAYFTVRKPYTKNGVTEDRDVLTVYFDLSWAAVCAMHKKEPNARVTVDKQARLTGKIFETAILDDPTYTAEAIANSKRLREEGARLRDGIPGSATKAVAHPTPVAPKSKVTPGVVFKPGASSYADAINAAMKEL